MTIRNNVITGTGQSGIEGIVSNNQLHDIGGGGIPGFRVKATNSQIVNNTLTSSAGGVRRKNDYLGSLAEYSC